MLRQLLDGITKYLRALQALGQLAESWNTLIVYIISNNLDPKNIKAKLPSTDELINFQRKVYFLENLYSSG